MSRVLVSILSLGLSAGTADAKTPATECLGPNEAKGHLIYLHGLTPPGEATAEEGENRKALEQLARELSLRIAMPRGSLCPTGKVCWPAADKNEVLKTFDDLREKAKSCWSGNPRYDLLGFSNGGYFAFKLYKVHQDPQLARILATGSAGIWDPKSDQPHPSSRFFLMIGRQDITLKKASQLAGILRKALPGFRFETFPGGHRLDYKATKMLLESR
jgi:pimeloyl-ACP methyl ester carboxylesterase